MRRPRRAVALLILLAASGWLPALASDRPLTTSNYRQVVPPAAPVAGLPRNAGFEPMTAVDGAGAIWVTAGISQTESRDPRNATQYVTGADVWRSTDGGRTLRWVAAPFNTVEDMPGLAGLDVDIAVAPVRNSQGHFTVYVASGWVPGVALAYSTDGGASWSVRHINNVPLADRPWLTATGPCGIYVTYKHQPSNDTLVNRFDLCDPTSFAAGSALNPLTSTAMALEGTVGLSNRVGKPVVAPERSPYAGTLYVPMLECDLPTPDHYVANAQVSNDECPDHAAVDLAISTDGGLTFENRRIAAVPRGRVPLWGVSAAVDTAGALYVSWFDDLDAFIVSSRDGGRTWTRPLRLNSARGAAAYPTVAAGRPGDVAVAWYGTDRRADVNDATAKGMGAAGAKGAATWYLHIARSSDGGRTWQARRVGRPLHRGAVCTWGTNCAGAGDRNLFDNFGAAIWPVNNRLTVAHMADDLSDSIVNRWTVVTSQH